VTPRTRLLPIAIAALTICTSAAAQKVFRWVDDQGLVHYGDSVPPEYANRDRNILNQHGVAIGFEEGEVTAEERAELERVAAEKETVRLKQVEATQRDNMLLATYLSVADIEDLRDRRLELLESQIKVTELYLTNLRKRLVALQEEASAYKPYTLNENAPQVPENLAVDLSRTAGSINLYEQMLARTRRDQQALKESFERDITRFNELKAGRRL
jgi:hypothetical protein